jgi:hypothetical protein
MSIKNPMAISQPANAEKKIKVKGILRFTSRRSFTPKKTMFAAPTQGLKHIFDNTGIAKATSTFNLNVKAISEHIANRLEFDGPLAVLAICELKEPIITFPDDPTDPSNLIKTPKNGRGNITMPMINKNDGMGIPRRSTTS